MDRRCAAATGRCKAREVIQHLEPGELFFGVDVSAGHDVRGIRERCRIEVNFIRDALALIGQW
jgi:hypothetical protein